MSRNEYVLLIMDFASLRQLREDEELGRRLQQLEDEQIASLDGDYV